MKFELILPRQEKTKLAHLGMYIVPMGASYLTANIGDDVEIRIIDENLTDVDYIWNPDLVGLSVMTSQADRAMEISKRYKELGIPSIWGGIHPTVVDQTNNENIASFVVGEGENLISKILSDFKKGELQRRYQDSNPVDLDKVIPRKDLFKPDVRVILDTMVASRGCPNGCDFCSASHVYGKKVRRVSIPKILEGIEKMISDYGIFCDDNITSNRRFVGELFNELKKYNKTWFVQIDPKAALDKEIAEMMGKAGVKVALIGFESANPENFIGNKKYVPPSEWKKAVENLHRNNMAVNGQIIIGFDNDKMDIFDKTEKAIVSSGIDIIGVSMLTPLPGTALYSRIEPRIFDRKWSNYDLYHVVFEPKHMSPEVLAEGVKRLDKITPSMYSFMRDALSR